MRSWLEPISTQPGEDRRLSTSVSPVPSRVSKLVLICLITVVCSDVQPVLAQRGGPSFFSRDAVGESIAPQDMDASLGVAIIPNRAAFEQLSYQGPDVMRDSYLADLEFVKFVIQRPSTGPPQVYWMNTERFRAHPHFMREVGLGGRDLMRGAVTYLPRLRAPDGSLGRYLFDFQPRDRYSFDDIQLAYRALIKTMPSLQGKLAFHPLEGNLAIYHQEQARYEAAELPVHLDEDVYGDIGYLPLNLGVSFGRLRLLENDMRSAPRDIVICRSLPNELPRVAGVLSLVRQTPLSHVNLRAVQDKVPNAFVINALSQPEVQALLGKWVRYEVTPQGYKLREATLKEVNDHFADLRPTTALRPRRNLTVRTIRPLTDIQFTDAGGFGVKTANLAAMHSFDFPAGTLPEGFGVPFYFYDAFMRHNGFYQLVEDLLASPEFQADHETQLRELKQLRSLIRQGKLPPEMERALTRVQQAFPEGTSIRCRSSTNNEDLASFSGAGLYESYTHHPREGHLSKSIKQVYASLWTFRAFEQREFHRVDHSLVAMGVLLHPNFSDEQANGVAVTDDILYASSGNYYVNTQVGEDLVTNPSAQASPEEILLGWWKRDGHQVVREPAPGKRLLTGAQLDELRQRLARIHARFRDHYGKTDDDAFAMEIEFKITDAGKLVIKQARPWVF